MSPRKVQDLLSSREEVKDGYAFIKHEWKTRQDRVHVPSKPVTSKMALSFSFFLQKFPDAALVTRALAGCPCARLIPPSFDLHVGSNSSQWEAGFIPGAPTRGCQVCGIHHLSVEFAEAAGLLFARRPKSGFRSGANQKCSIGCFDLNCSYVIRRMQMIWLAITPKYITVDIPSATLKVILKMLDPYSGVSSRNRRDPVG